VTLKGQTRDPNMQKLFDDIHTRFIAWLMVTGFLRDAANLGPLKLNWMRERLKNYNIT